MPTAEELEVLRDAWLALEFAAKSGKDLGPTIAEQIAEVQQAADTGGWSADVSAMLWRNFSAVCALIKPASIDSIHAMRSTVRSRSAALPWLFRKSCESDSDVVSRRYIIGLIVLILCILPFQLYAWVGDNLFREGDELTVQINKKISDLKLTYGDSLLKDSNDPIRNSQIMGALGSITRDAVRLKGIADMIVKITPVQGLFESPSMPKVAVGVPQAVESGLAYAEFSALYFQERKSNAALSIGVGVSFFLPIMFGLLGALAFVIRHILQQIGEGSFVSQSRARNFVRLMLGALMGLVVGIFVSLSSTFSLPPLAIAFLAGYGVESFFSMFDGLIEKLKPATPNKTAPTA